MKTLYIIRHAKAEEENILQADFDRNLNERGKKDAHYVGEQLKKMQIVPQKIIASPANRTKQTAEIIAQQINYDTQNISIEKNLYDATQTDFMGIIENLDNQLNKVFIIGHNPACTLVADYLSQAEINFVPTCTVTCLQCNIDNWQALTKGIATLDWLKTPKDWE
jgi:phosphohistidine phosphatase